ncbi:MAG: PhoU domain-containing protein [Nitrososphaerales archaeon]
MSIDMQLRKVQQMGGSTLLISLPKDWADAASVSKGAVLSIENSPDGGLMIYPVRNQGTLRSEKEIEITYPSKFEGNPANEITAAYLLGYDLIRVKGKERIASKDRERIILAIKGLIGLEVVEENASEITCQFLVDNTAVEPSKITRRISSLVRAMVSDTMKQVTYLESMQFEPIGERDDEVDRLHFLLVRLIRTAVRDPRTAGKFGLSSIDCLDYRVAASALETAGDYAVELSNAIALMGKLGKETRGILHSLGDLLDIIQDSALRSFVDRDYTLAREALDKYKEFELILNSLRKTNNSSYPELLHFTDIIERIGRCPRDIADLVSPMRPA